MSLLIPSKVREAQPPAGGADGEESVPFAGVSGSLEARGSDGVVVSVVLFGASAFGS